ncbi:MAG TPA: hypothetical protein DG577_06945 [Firmicutes bacterium]|nr:hypothetical protein [Bacillota bacterium]HBS93552.1 hypothetical protein [Bacillota bacterium]HCX79131.1 hypothetical protein [Bacillota bacterium]
MGAVVLLPILLQSASGMLISAGVAARNVREYYPLFAVLMIAVAINIIMIVWHRKKDSFPKK